MGNSNEGISRDSERFIGPFSDLEYKSLEKKFGFCKDSCLDDNTSEILGVFECVFHLELRQCVSLEKGMDAKCIGVLFYHYIMRVKRKKQSERIRDLRICLNDVVYAVARSTRGSSQSITKLIFELFDHEGTNTLGDNELNQVFAALLCMAGCDHEAGQAEQVSATASSLARALVHFSATEFVSLETFTDWMCHNLPLSYSIFASWVTRKCLHPDSKVSYLPPSLSCKSDIASIPQVILLSCITANVQGELDRIYTSTEDGLSFNRICYHILGYSGPTLILIRDADNDVFGMYCDTQWKESNHFYGGNDCFLFRLERELGIFRTIATHDTGNRMYLNTKGYALPHGLGMGGNIENFRIFLSEDLDEACYANADCLTYEAGALTSRKHFGIHALEIWGCSGKEGRRKQAMHRQQTAEMIDRARRVDKAQFASSDFDKEMFLGNTFGHGTDRARVIDDVS